MARLVARCRSGEAQADLATLEGAERRAEAARWASQLARVQAQQAAQGNAAGRPSVEARALAYLAKAEPALEGSGGRVATLRAVKVLVCDLAMGEAALPLLLAAYNPRCKPPWSERALREMVRSTARNPRLTWGGMLVDRRS